MRDMQIELIRQQIDEIKNDVDDCDNQVPLYSVNVTEYIDNRILDQSITEKDGKLLKDELRATLDKFKTNCWCRKK